MSWHWLSKLPSTNALVLTGIFMALTTTFSVVIWNWKPPEGWFTFIIAFSITGAAQFTAKRITHKSGVAAQDGK